ncbi:hypothetical protein [Rhodoferax sp.]|uniref:hypothetical protein n=1 Tax=Rhodoferax sp. TaxID=50421 RepID=UPI002761F589|nr:hypothetical protein [Rhodoferax sp.]
MESMGRISLFADIAGRPTRTVDGNPLVTAGVVAFNSADLPLLRSKTPATLPKWKHLTRPAARRAVQFLLDHAVVVSSVTVNRDTAQWAAALEDSDRLHAKIASQSRAKAGWAKLPIVLAYELLSRACFLALAHVLRTQRPQHVFAHLGATAIECDVVCDKEFSADEDIEVFTSFWDDKHVPTEALWRLGYTVTHPSVTVTTDDDERLLMWADIAAGMCHSARLPKPGRIAMPLTCTVSRRLLEPLAESNKLALDAYAFGTTYDDVFGEVMNVVRGDAPLS